MLYWHREAPALAAGEHWKFLLKLKTSSSRVNFQGQDRERWFFAENIGGLATVRSGERLGPQNASDLPVLRTREKIGRAISDLTGKGSGAAVVRALAIADRSDMQPSDRSLLSASGTAHLLAISGLHIGLAGAMGFWLTRLLMYPLGLFRLCRHELQISLAGGLAVALAYTALAGFGVSSLRALTMLAVVSFSLGSRRSIHALRAWLGALAVVLILDPFAPLSAGTWFSFGAVAVLLMLFRPRTAVPPWWKSMLLAQAGIVLATLPLNLYWFQFASPLGLVSNLIAIPWVSFILVPLTLCGVLALGAGTVIAAALLNTAAWSAEGLLAVLELLVRWQGQLLVPFPPTLPSVILATLGGAMLMLPRGIPARWLGLFMWLPLLLHPPDRTAKKSLRVDVLDVGQGLATLVSTQNSTLLYDSGPGDAQESGLVHTVIAPALGRLGASAPERIVISHGDLDHAGGLGQLEQRFPDVPMFRNLRQSGRSGRPCREGLEWVWDGLEFKVLHPSASLPYLGNDSSCVVSVGRGRRDESAWLLLTGDISSAVEQRLVRQGVQRHRLLLVPHHGSATSSSTDLIDSTRPDTGIAAAGRGNRFGFPVAEVVERYESSGARFWSTDSCGAISLTLHDDGTIQANSARRLRRGMWRWPAGPECP
jgi:competence protein ComEC